ncbi:hypothetical protein ACVIW2_008373 [Bradyrhizobium huanghuaihaiense]|uniref:Uncharacterized protein n=1 Tax=Bradyrhizobium huanghuaihaiense TaxID=990078 RepID=A0A562RGL8_9BRAD|nr:hypothetical protein IQ16_04093 [Bradyrhizobium huanghuaihaiense]
MVEVPATYFTPDHSPDPEQCQAIRKEIGERLRGALAEDVEPLPMRLEGLVERLAELDGGAPSIAPNGGDASAFLPVWKLLRRLVALWRFP